MAVMTFYGPLSDVMGRKRVIDIGAVPISIGALVARLEESDPDFRAALLRMRVRYARNNLMASADEMVSDSDEIAFLPPFSGG